ncbi:MAG TPA: hypothetical protein VIM87_25640 [Chitinophaga sp.]|uniref:hypothetical protein n=1 Tax=Chitinophaga sp. TaxID=1869181 RepID=UPI002F9578F4
MKLLPALFIILSTCSIAFAQDSTVLPHKVSRKMKQELALTGPQSRQLQNIETSFRRQAKSIRRNETLSSAEKDAQLHRLQQTHADQVKALLSATQYVQYQQWMIKSQERWQRAQRLQDRQLPGKTTPGKT